MDAKIEPLGMPMGVDVVLHQAVIFLVADFCGEEQVAALEPALEDQRAILPALQSIASAAVTAVLNEPAVAKFV